MRTASILKLKSQNNVAAASDSNRKKVVATASDLGIRYFEITLLICDQHPNMSNVVV